MIMYTQYQNAYSQCVYQLQHHACSYDVACLHVIDSKLDGLVCWSCGLVLLLLLVFLFHTVCAVFSKGPCAFVYTIVDSAHTLKGAFDVRSVSGCWRSELGWDTPSRDPNICHYYYYY